MQLKCFLETINNCCPKLRALSGQCPAIISLTNVCVYGCVKIHLMFNIILVVALPCPVPSTPTHDWEVFTLIQSTSMSSSSMFCCCRPFAELRLCCLRGSKASTTICSVPLISARQNGQPCNAPRNKRTRELHNKFTNCHGRIILIIMQK